MREIDIWYQLHHQHVLPLLGVFSGFFKTTGMVSSWCKNGDINAYLKTQHANPLLKELQFRLVGPIPSIHDEYILTYIYRSSYRS